jgi:formate-dependent nitrite reductase membrane component NrfD
MLPMLFLVSALKTGTASICLVGCFVKGFGGMSRDEIETNKFMVHSIDFVLMILAIIAVVLFVFGLYSSPRSSVEAAKLIMGGEFTFLFWGLVVGLGILFPLREHNPWISMAVAASVLVGGFLLRYVVVYAGQVSQVISA